MPWKAHNQSWLSNFFLLGSRFYPGPCRSTLDQGQKTGHLGHDPRITFLKSRRDSSILPTRHEHLLIHRLQCLHTLHSQFRDKLRQLLQGYDGEIYWSHKMQIWRGCLKMQIRRGCLKMQIRHGWALHCSPSCWILQQSNRVAAINPPGQTSMVYQYIRCVWITSRTH